MAWDRRDPGAEGNSAGDDTAPQAPVGKHTRVDDAAALFGFPASGGAVQRKPAASVDLTYHPPEQDFVSDHVQQFRTALGRKDRAAAEQAWSVLGDAERRAFGKSPSITGDLEAIVRLLGPMTVPIMAQCGLDFAGREGLIDLMLAVGMPHWFDGLGLHGGPLLTTFLDHLPARDKLDGTAIKKLERLMRGTNSLALARPLFERIYVPVRDASYSAGSLRTAAWKAEHIHRLYDVLSTHLPVAHVRAVTAFYIGHEHKDGGAWKPVTYGWWTDNGNVVLPEKSADTGGHLDHNMTGGSNAQADPKSGKGTTKAEMNHFDVTALHEVGHAVGGRLGGHAWAESHPFVDWKTGLAADAWSQKLWGDDAALTARAHKTAGHAKVLAAHDARVYLATSISGIATPPAQWTADEVEDAVLQQYADQPLTRYWQAYELESDASKSFKFPATENYGRDGRVYVWLSRNDRGFSSYTQAAHQAKVSWYSLSSPHEWFAEQYAHYYRHGKHGDGLDPGTKAKLDELDTQQPSDHELLQPGADGDSAGMAAGGDNATATASAAVAASDELTGRRLPFPW